VVRSISAFEKVTLITNEDTVEAARRLCGEAAEYLVIPHNDAWMRDNGPTYVKSAEGMLAGIDWKFNAWGEKYHPYYLDGRVAGEVLKQYGIPGIKVPIVLEGGSIHVDGEGTLLTTEQCLLNPNRNPQLDRNQIEEVLKSHLNVSKIIWLKKGLYGDETDGHIDNAACFAKPGTVLMQACHEPGNPNYEITRENLEILNQITDAKGRKLEIVEIPQPPERYYKGVSLTLSYLNFYFVNNGIILPLFGGDAAGTDQRAEQVLRELFPGRRIVPVDGMKLIKEGGNVHCITQQVPVPGWVKI
jgi:agmatine deiminase